MKKNNVRFIGALSVATALCAGLAPLASATLPAAGLTHNPHFIDEPFNFGEWTMDFDAATNRVSAEAGEAFTLVFFSGVLWCPWCLALERDVFDQDEFLEFAATNKIALVMIDNPRRDGSAPTLLRPDVYQGTNPDDWRNGNSGAEYLADHGDVGSGGVTPEEAEAVLARNAALQAAWTVPGRDNIGYPTALLLRKDGSIAGRFNGYYETTDSTATPVKYTYLLEQTMLRYTEFLEMARTASEDGEELNNYVEWTQDTLGWEDSRAATLRAADRKDIYLLETEAGAYPVVTVQGPEDADIQVELLNASGKTLQALNGSLLAGVTLSAEALPEGAMYVSVSTNGVDISVFSAASLSSTVREYTVTTTQIKEPGVIGFMEKMISASHKDANVVIELTRTDGCYGAASLSVKLDAGASTAVAGLDFTDVFGSSGLLVEWAAGESGIKTVTLPLLPGDGNDRTIVLQISDVTGAAEWPDAGRFTLTLKEGDAPFFRQDEVNITSFLRVKLDTAVPVLNTTGGKVSVAKRSGSLPRGIRASYDKEIGGLRLTGVPTDTGEYTAIFQVSERVGSQTVKGEFVTVIVTVRELAEVNPEAMQAITAAEGAVIDPVTRRVIGVVRFSISKTGRMTAKYRGADGTDSFSAKTWTDIQNNGRVEVSIASRKRVLTVAQNVSGGLESYLYGPVADEKSVQYEVLLTAAPWTKASPATAYQGYYTASLSRVTQLGQGAWVPEGYSTLTLSLPASVAHNGTMKFAGTLADGTAYSGSALLLPDGGDVLGVQAHLAVFSKVRKSTFGALLAIDAYASETYQDWPSSVSACGDTVPYWMVNSGFAETSFDMELDICGGYYNQADSLIEYWEKYEGIYGPFQLLTDGDFPESVNYGIATNLPLVNLSITEKTLKVSPMGANPTKAKLTLNKKTGTIKGSFKIPFVNNVGKIKNVSASYSGVLLPGWTGDCGCSIDGAELPEKPFAMGSFRFRDKMTIPGPRGSRTVTFMQCHPIIIKKADAAVVP